MAFVPKDFRSAVYFAILQIVFVILPTGMQDPQSAVSFLKKLNPADIAAIFITCGVEDLSTKLEKLEQVRVEDFDSSFLHDTMPNLWSDRRSVYVL